MVKYRLQVNSQKEQDWLVEIDFPTYDGDPIETIGIENPIQIEYSSGSNDDPFASHIIQQSATFQLYSDVIDVEELQTLPDGDVRCRVYYNGQLKHSGFIISDGIQEADSGVATPVTIKSIDGLSFLEDIRYFISNYGTITINDQASSLRCPMNFIRAALYSSSNLNNPLPIKWSTELRSEQYPTDDMLAGRNTIGNDGKIMLEFEYSVMWYLDNILKTARCWLYQKDGFWYIEDKVKTTKDGGVMNGWQITTVTTAQTATSLSEDLNTGELSGLFILEDTWHGVKKPLGGVNVTYQSSMTPDNILPNGNFDNLSSGLLIDWRFLPSVGSDPSLQIENSLTLREGYAVELTNFGTAIAEAPFSTTFPVPFDSKVLFKSFNFGFTILPKNGFPTDSDGIIQWGTSLKISVTFTYDGGDPYFLNENGFWQSGASQTDLGIFPTGVYRSDPILDTTNNEAWFTGSPNIGDALVVSIPNSTSSNPTRIDYTFIVTSLESGNLQLALDRLLENIPTNIGGGQIISNKRVVMNDANNGSVQYRSGITVRSPQQRTYKSGQTQDFQYIYPSVANAKLNDIIGIQFSGKGGNSEILVPQIPEYNGLDGRLRLLFHVKPGQRYTIDDVYISVQNNNDLYEIRDTSSKSPIEDKSVGISSSFSGFMLSNYMVNYSLSPSALNWTGGKSLTQIYGESILNWRNTPCKIYEGSIDRVIQAGDYITVKGVNYHVLNAVIQGDGITKVTAFEAKWNTKTYSVTHKGSNKDERVD